MSGLRGLRESTRYTQSAPANYIWGVDPENKSSASGPPVMPPSGNEEYGRRVPEFKI